MVRQFLYLSILVFEKCAFHNNGVISPASFLFLIFLSGIIIFVTFTNYTRKLKSIKLSYVDYPHQKWGYKVPESNWVDYLNLWWNLKIFALKKPGYLRRGLQQLRDTMVKRNHFYWWKWIAFDENSVNLTIMKQLLQVFI